jgi:glycosyltransferase involved in cell wall biosynthesis
VTQVRPRVVAIDARGYFTGGGVGRYTRHLVSELVASPTRGVELLLLISNQHGPEDLDLPAAAADAARPVTVRVSQAEWMNAAQEDRWLEGEVADADLFHSLTGHWLSQDRPSIATLLDMTPILKPRLAGADARRSGQRIGDQLARARHLLAISHSTARDAQSVPGRLPSITVVPLAAAPIFRPGVPSAETLSALALKPDGFLLAVSVLSPHKNLVRLVDAYAASGVDVPLVVAGAQRDDTHRVQSAIRRHGLEDRVRLIGRVADADLAALYASCRAFVYPSLYEGFGLPVLEAMACGAAVVASRTSSIPEVAGDAALLIDPARTRSLVAALKRIHHDAALREQLRRLAVVRAASFSWSRTAAATLRIYDGVLEARAA